MESCISEDRKKIIVWGGLVDKFVMEPLASGALLVSRNGTVGQGRTFNANDKTYVAAAVPEVLAGVLRMPASYEPFTSVAQLLSELTQVLMEQAGLDDAAAFLLAVFTLYTWVRDGSSAISLNLVGGNGFPTRSLQVLSALVRRPLPLVDATMKDILEFSAGISPTFLFSQPNPSFMRRLAAATAVPGFALLHQGKLAQLDCTVVVASDVPLGLGGLEVSVLEPSGMPQLQPLQIEQLSVSMQPKLLGYRMLNLLEARNSQFDAPELGRQLRPVARDLGAALLGDHELESRFVELLLPLDQQNRSDLSQQLPAVVIEAVLVLLHEGKTSAYVSEITECTNQILLGRGERKAQEAKVIGAILRQLGLRPQRKAKGYRLELDQSVNQRVHRLAADHSALSLLTPPESCPICSEEEGRACE